MPDEFINPMIQKLLNDYYANPSKCWNDKIVAINLIFAMYIKTFAQKSNYLFILTIFSRSHRNESKSPI